MCFFPFIYEVIIVIHVLGLQREERRGYKLMKQAKQQAGFKRNVSDPGPRIQFSFQIPYVWFI